jgi:hypothetical protein|nr:MAG TPA: hypothetical protein [Caudoviricetes sp.]
MRHNCSTFIENLKNNKNIFGNVINVVKYKNDKIRYKNMIILVSNNKEKRDNIKGVYLKSIGMW